MALSDFLDRITALVRDDTGKISGDDQTRALADAVERYSLDRPKAKVEDLNFAAGGNLLSLPAGWLADFSRLVSLETPIGSVPPVYINPESWSIYGTPTGDKIMLESALAAGTQIRAVYTIRHTLDAAGDTIPQKDREPVSAYAAAQLLDQLAALFSGDSDSTIAADNVNHGSKAQEYAARARALRKAYFDTLGIDPKREVAAGAVTALPSRDERGWPRLTHPYWRA